jgi:hypothetical protein
MRQLEAGGFEVALHTHLHPPIPAQPGWIYDRLANVLQLRACLGGADVIRRVPVASLTTDAFGE